jgi:hypothetical protein
LAGIGCLGGKHPIEQDGVGYRPADAAESRPQGCYNNSCLLWKELPQLGDHLPDDSVIDI